MLLVEHMSQADAAELVLRDTGRAMHRREITDEILRRGLDVWAEDGPGNTPWESVGRAITQEIANLGERSRFTYLRKGSGTYVLRELHGGVAMPDGVRPGVATQITVQLDAETTAAVDQECARRAIPRGEFVVRALKRQLWELEAKRAEDDWLQSYRDAPQTEDEMALARSQKFVPDPWDRPE